EISTPDTSGASLAIFRGMGFLVRIAIDADVKKQINENKKLDEIKNLQDEKNSNASQLNNLDQQIAQKQNKLNDPNTPE
ncbi:9812_t:CDS:1, partial [Funneliformis caledonium]